MSGPAQKTRSICAASRGSARAAWKPGASGPSSSMSVSATMRRPPVLRAPSVAIAEAIAAGKSPDQLDELGGSSRLLPYCEFNVGKNDVLYMRMSSGGGYGDPLEREPQRVLQDVEDGIISRQEAREIYGVAIEGSDPALNLAATEKWRAELRQERLREQK